MDDDPAQRPNFAHALTNLGGQLGILDRHREKLAAWREAVAVWRALASGDEALYGETYRAARSFLQQRLQQQGFDDEAINLDL
ncbi:hypothetical protein GCM10010191_02500 [Actinomadura vinacea]|uniref:Uncharacterized protein n=1 Tax=Actinomadura vinacea TaxID=115336 RepID=A0ABN3IAT7_9ACTN